MAASVFDSLIHSRLFPTGETGRLFSDTAEIRAMLLVEGALAKVQGRTYEEMKAIRTAAVAAGRFGDPAELADFCVYICSAQAGFLTGQNLLMDGGKYPGTF